MIKLMHRCAIPLPVLGAAAALFVLAACAPIPIPTADEPRTVAGVVYAAAAETPPPVITQIVVAQPTAEPASTPVPPSPTIAPQVSATTTPRATATPPSATATRPAANGATSTLVRNGAAATATKNAPGPTGAASPAATVGKTAITQTVTPAANGTTTSVPVLAPGSTAEGKAVVVGVVGNMNLEFNAQTPFLSSVLYDSLLRLNPTTGALEPGLAEAYTVSQDGLTITFKLRTARWHNGDPLTAQDVVATLTALSSPEFRGTPVTDFGTFQKASAPDDRTVVLTFREIYCPALTGIGTTKIVPRAVATSANFPRLKPEQLIGTGPLKVVARGDDQLVLARNADYYLGAPQIESWVVKYYATATALRTAFTAQQMDVMAADAGDYAVVSKLPGARVQRAPSNEYALLLFNQDTVELDDPRVRQALNYALDRNVLLNDVGGQGTQINAGVLPGYWATAGELPQYGFDLARAKGMLAEAGWRDGPDGLLRKDGKPLALQLWTEADDPVLEPLAFRLREMYAALGLKIELELDDRAGWITRAFAHRFDLLLIRRKYPLDPDQRWYWQSDQTSKTSGFNFGSYANGRVDALLKESLRVPACVPSDRAALFTELNRTLIADPPGVFILAPYRYLVTRDRITNATPSAFAGDYAGIVEWKMAP